MRERAREMRKNQTPAEQVFWQRVRNKQVGGYKFNRQHIIEYSGQGRSVSYFIADFYCHEKKLVVEIDGGIHFNQSDKDQRRTAILESLGLTVIRFDNGQVMTRWLLVRAQLMKILEKQ